MSRVIKDGQVAVLISPGFGAGWSTWNADSAHNNEDLLFDPWIVDILINKDYSDSEKIERVLAHCALKYPGAYTGGIKDLTVVWVPKDTAFIVEEYDGSESIKFRDQEQWMIA
jgi:hypothetical protein